MCAYLFLETIQGPKKHLNGGKTNPEENLLVKIHVRVLSSTGSEIDLDFAGDRTRQSGNFSEKSGFGRTLDRCFVRDYAKCGTTFWLEMIQGVEKHQNQPYTSPRENWLRNIHVRCRLSFGCLTKF